MYFNDFGNNDSMESVDVYLLFVDTTPVNNVVQSYDLLLENVAEVLLLVIRVIQNTLIPLITVQC